MKQQELFETEKLDARPLLCADAGAEFSECGKYRYKLWRIWDKSKPLAMCIGLNPSTANGVKNDQTISYLIKMLTILGYGGFYMTNLFGIISSKPQVLLTHPDPVGENDKKLDEVRAICQDVIVCWGMFKEAQKRIYDVLPRFQDALCFGLNNNNCLKTGCVQGGIGYWQWMQIHFPKVFDKMATVEHDLTNRKGKPVTMLKDQSKGGGLVFLKPHPAHPDVKDISMMKGRPPKPLLECNGFCGINDLAARNETEKELNYGA